MTSVVHPALMWSNMSWLHACEVLDFLLIYRSNLKCFLSRFSRKCFAVVRPRRFISKQQQSGRKNCRYLFLTQWEYIKGNLHPNEKNDEHPRHFYMGVPPGLKTAISSWHSPVKVSTREVKVGKGSGQGSQSSCRLLKLQICFFFLKKKT